MSRKYYFSLVFFGKNNDKMVFPPKSVPIFVVGEIVRKKRRNEHTHIVCILYIQTIKS